MRRLGALALMLSIDGGCRSIENQIIARGGTRPIACINSIEGYAKGVSTCRDAHGIIWVCGDSNAGVDCIPLNALEAVWHVLPPTDAQ